MMGAPRMTGAGVYGGRTPPHPAAAKAMITARIFRIRNLIV